MQVKPRIRLRANGGKKSGLGHIYRMIALANLLENDFDCSFIVQDQDQVVTGILQKNNCRHQTLGIYDLNHVNVNNSLQDPVKKNDILVLDGYCFDTAYQQFIKNTIGCKLVCIDDIFSFPFIADIVINHAGGMTEKDYNVLPDSKLLLGPAYAILRKEFYNLAAVSKKIDTIEHIFISFGGADANNITGKVTQDFISSSFTAKQISVVIGSAYQHEQQLHTLVKEHSSIKIYRDIGVTQMLDLMQQADVAICSASTIAYEFCSVSGLLYILQTADNQSSVFKFLIAEKMALPYKNFYEVVDNAIVNIAREQVLGQKNHFDGLAGVRLRKEFNKLYLRNNYFLRNTVAGDVDIYFIWANDSEVRKNSFNPDIIKYEAHCSWFNANLHANDTRFYIFTTAENIAIANIRFKIQKDTATLSFLVDERFRGMGFAKEVLAKGTTKFFQENTSVKEVFGLVKDDNAASIAAFKASEFEEIESLQKNVKCFIKISNHEYFI